MNPARADRVIRWPEPRVPPCRANPTGPSYLRRLLEHLTDAGVSQTSGANRRLRTRRAILKNKTWSAVAAPVLIVIVLTPFMDFSVLREFEHAADRQL